MAKPQIISTSSEPFADRGEAARLLAAVLADYCGQRPVVLGIPRGGVVIAVSLARELGGEADMIISRKLRTPGYPELAMGAVAEGGQIFLNQTVVREMAVSPDAIERERQRQLAEVARRRELIRPRCPKINLRDRLVIVTDDGVATGATFRAALWAVRAEDPRRLVAAIPVGSEESVRHLAEAADDLICLRVPPFFAAVGQFYRRFEAVPDETVLRLLEGGRAPIE